MYADLSGGEPESKITFTHEDAKPCKYSWGEFLGSFLGSNLGKVIFFLLLPIVALTFWLFRYDDFENGCHIKIYPSIIELSNLKIKDGIRLLKANSAQDYKKFCASVENISQKLPCDGLSGGCYDKNRPNDISVSTVFRPLENYTETTAATIVHEVCHLSQGRERRLSDDEECYRDYCRVLDAMGVKKGADTRCVKND